MLPIMYEYRLHVCLYPLEITDCGTKHVTLYGMTDMHPLIVFGRLELSEASDKLYMHHQPKIS